MSSVRRVDELIEALKLQLAVVWRLEEADLAVESACPGWNVGDVLRHSMGVTQKFTDFASGKTNSPESPRGDLLGTGYRALFERVASDAERAWSQIDSGRACHLPFGVFSAEEAAGINLFDVLAHTWDVADVVEVELSCSDAMWEAGLDAAIVVLGRGRDSRHYQPEVSVGAGASPRQRFLGYLGRGGPASAFS